jgi:chromosome segregation ATPase
VADEGDFYLRDLAFEDLGLDTDAIAKSQVGGLNAQEAEHLRTLVLGLNEKLRSLQLMQMEVQNMRVKLQDSYSARKTLQASIESTTKQLKDQADKQDKVHAQLVKDREEAVDGLRRQHLQWKDLCQREEALESQLELANAELQKNSAEAENFAEMTAHIKRLQSEVKESEQQREAMKAQYLQSLGEFETRYDELQESIDSLANNKSVLQASLQEASQELAEQRKRNDNLASENLQLRSDISLMEAQIAAISDESRQLSTAHELALSHEKAAEQLQEALHRSSKDFEANLQDLKVHNEALLEEKVDLDAKLSSLENDLQVKADQVNELTRNKFQLAAERQTLQQLLVVRNDLEQINTELRTKSDLNTSLQQQLLKELLMVSDYLLALSEQTFTSHRSVLALKDQLQAKEQEATSLQQQLQALQSKRVTYVPADLDHIDQVLGAYINSREAELLVPFIRDGPGRYRYGQRQVEVSVKDDKLKVRVGGGWSFIEDFIETYESIEVEKLSLKA